jgi:OmcA/MtrC family decaheme c-type cytochrome
MGQITLDRRRVRLATAGLVTLVLAAAVGLSAAPGPGAAFQYRIVSIEHTAPGQYPLVTFSVVNPQTGIPYDLKADPAWTQTASGASRLFLQIAWNTTDVTNTNSGSNGMPGGRGAAMPIPVNALGAAVVANGDGTYRAASLLPVPATATGTGIVGMEGHPAGRNPVTGLWTVRVPVKSAYRNFAITATSLVARRQVVDVQKCMQCHRSDGTGVAPQLTLHGNNRTEEPQVCVLCHNPNNTDIPYRQAADPKPIIGPYRYPEQGLDFKRLVHGIHAGSRRFTENPLVVIGFNHTIFDSSTLKEYPGELKNCVACHVDNGTTGTFELPLRPGVLGSTMSSRSIQPDGTIVIDTDPANDVKITPTAAVCSSCHDKREVIDHMVQTGGASFNTTQAAIDSGAVRERCVNCHGAGRDKSVRKVHLWDD